jgi:hypothetical protein
VTLEVAVSAPPPAHPNRALAVLWLSAAWFVVALTLGWSGLFDAQQGAPPTTLGLAAAGPPIAAVVLLACSHQFRSWAGRQDLPLLTSLQAWRAGGLAFLVLADAGVLPAGFAVPAGVGDVAVGLTAPVVAALLGRRLVRSATYVGWTVFGIVDLIAAVTLGVLHSDSPVGLLTGDVDTAVMERLPMSLVPTFFVPFLLVVHLVSLAAVTNRMAPHTSRSSRASGAPTAG